MVAPLSRRLSLVLGGVRSGKSSFAEGLAAECGRNVLYVATGVETDPEMAERIRRHRESRPPSWSTLEEPAELAVRIESEVTGDCAYDAVLIDSLDLWVSNILLKYEADSPECTEEAMNSGLQHLLQVAQRSPAAFIMVSSEVGHSLVPSEPLGRRFQDLMGLANQRVAAAADQVFLVVAGIPTRIRPPAMNYGPGV